MNRVRGMTLKQFNEVVEDMRSVYKFKNENAILNNLIDLRTGANMEVEIHTVDEKTGVFITMQKGVSYNE